MVDRESSSVGNGVILPPWDSHFLKGNRMALQAMGLTSIDMPEKIDVRPKVKICPHLTFYDVRSKPITAIEEFDVLTLRCFICGVVSIVWEIEK